MIREKLEPAKHGIYPNISKSVLANLDPLILEIEIQIFIMTEPCQSHVILFKP